MNDTKNLAADQQEEISTAQTDDTASTKSSLGKKPKKSWKKELLDWISAFASAAFIVFLINTFVFQPVKVSGNSMTDTLHNNDIMIATKFDYLLGEPKRFDIVICKYPNRSEIFVKRIVGLPGDILQMENGLLSVNGETYPEEYIMHKPNYEIAEYQVPDGHYYVLGDNRSSSNDSHLIGPISRNQILGHVRLVVFPFNRIQSVDIHADQIKPFAN